MLIVRKPSDRLRDARYAPKIMQPFPRQHLAYIFYRAMTPGFSKFVFDSFVFICYF